MRLIISEDLGLPRFFCVETGEVFRVEIFDFRFFALSLQSAYVVRSAYCEHSMTTNLKEISYVFT